MRVILSFSIVTGSLTLTLTGALLPDFRTSGAHIDFAGVARVELVVGEVRAQVLAAGVERGGLAGECGAGVDEIETADGEIDDGLEAGLVAGLFLIFGSGMLVLPSAKTMMFACGVSTSR